MESVQNGELKRKVKERFGLERASGAEVGTFSYLERVSRRRRTRRAQLS